MKRFFQPIEKEGSKKKPSLSASECSQEAEAKAEDERKEEAAEESSKEPLKFLTWNANSFLLRAKNNWPELSKLVEKLDPDVIAIQEVRMPAAGSKGAPKNPGELKDDTSSSRDEKQTLMRVISSPPFRNYHVWWSLADTKYGGTALFVKKHLQPKVFFSLDRTASKHEPDGRVILAEFNTVRLLNTYVPNNGWKDDETSFKRRRKWDKRMLEFVLQSSDKPLIWCGDLNVSHQEIDVSHPDFFRNAKQNGYIPPNKEKIQYRGGVLYKIKAEDTRYLIKPESANGQVWKFYIMDRGQPGFTLAERQRFSTILTEGKLIDAYRFLHKEQDMECGFSWSGNPVGKYRGKRMRIDYFIVSEKLKDRIASCEMHGQGIELEGFYGSDHCPLSLELLPETPESNPS